MAVELAHLSHGPEGQGENLPLLIAHGLYGSARNFNSLGKQLAKDRHVVLVDMRNHGGSPWDSVMTYPAMAADLAESIERLCDGRAAVMGHSMGGKAVMALALSRPDLVAGTIVVDMAPVAYDYSKEKHSHNRNINAMLGVDLSRITRRSDAEQMLAGLIEKPTLRSFLLQNLVIDEGQARWRLNLELLKAALPDLMNWPGEWPQPVFEGPALVVYGTASNYFKPEMEGGIRKLFPNVEFAPIDGAGHWLHAEQPEAFLSVVTGFLDNLV